MATACASSASSTLQIDMRERLSGSARGRLDPRVSLVALVGLNAAVAISPSFIVVAAAFFFSFACMLRCGRYRMALSWLAAFVLVRAAMSALMALSVEFSVYVSTLLMMWRVMPPAAFGVLFVTSTRFGELAAALTRCGVPLRMTIALGVALRFFPTARSEARAVREALRSRGMALTPVSFARDPAALFERFMVPYLHRIATVADELGNAVTSRGAESHAGRTSLYELFLSPADKVALAATTLLAIAAVVERMG